jgi:DNA repair protein RecN (Recombination protein N)
LRHGLAEIETVAPRSGEDAELAAVASRLSDADDLRLAAANARTAISGDPDDVSTSSADAGSAMAVALRALRGVAGSDRELDAVTARLEDAGAVIADLGSELAGYLDNLEADPGRLEQVMSRRAVLAALMRKYGDDIEAVLAWAVDAVERLALVDTSQEAIGALTARCDDAARELTALAASVTMRRTKAAARLQNAVTGELAALAMPNARIEVRVRAKNNEVVDGADRAASTAGTGREGTGREGAGREGAGREGTGRQGGGDQLSTSGIGPDGADDVAFLLRPHPDAPALALARGASGGELSRVMLALEVVLADCDPVPTLIFDEVDAGVGGQAAIEVGRRLALLATRRQVIVVTHLAQVAAFADTHLVVSRDAESGVRRSDVRAVEGSDRVAELARMLSGQDTAVAREHAAELLDSSRRDRLVSVVPAALARAPRARKTKKTG